MNTGTLGWAVVGPGRIAHRFAQALRTVPGCTLAAVVGRNAQRAQAFARQWGDTATVVADDLGEALASDSVDAVYVATPHPFHADAVRNTLRSGKAVLCEKPLTPNAAATAELIALAERHRAFLMEAVWTRFLPIYAQVHNWIEGGRIGAVRSMRSSFCIDVPFSATHRCHDPAQAGGALLDIGLYNITVSRMMMRNAAIQGFDVAAELGPLGCDRRLQATLDFGHGVASQFGCSFDGHADNRFEITGASGRITVHSGFWQATQASLTMDGQVPQTVTAPFACNGFEYQIEEVRRCLARGALESDLMPWRESLATIELMDAMRARMGVRYPFEP